MSENNGINEMEKQASVPYFIHEGMMTRMQIAMEKVENSNKRMLTALWSVCITLILVVVIFVVAYTENNKNWMKFTNYIQTTQTEDTVHASETPAV